MFAFTRYYLGTALAALLLFSTAVVSAHQGVRGLTVLQPDKIDWGLTFYTDTDGIVHLLGLDGRVINQWGSPEDEISWAKPVFDDRGDILAMTGINDIPGYVIPLPVRLVQFDRDGNRFFEWGDFELSRGLFAALHHDVVRLANGNTLVLCAALVDEPSISPNTLIDDCLMELDWQGNIVWEWYTYEHFDDFGFDDEAKQLISNAGGDWAHANSLSIIPPNSHTDPAFTPGNIMISYRQINTIAIIDRQTGDIVWRAGPEPALTIGQHDAYMIDQGLPGAGNIMAFDNGLQAGFPPISRPFSQVVEIDPTTKQIVWRYNATFSGFPQWDFFSPIISGAQRLVNGNTMITEGTKGRLFEIAPNGEIVWEFWNPYYESLTGPTGFEIKDYSVFRAYRMPLWWGWPSSLQ